MQRSRVFAIAAIAAAILIACAYAPAARWYETQRFVSAYDAADQTGREAVAAKYLSTLSSSDMIAALERQDPLCHSAAHPLGREIYRETQSLPEALRMCGSGCSYGCFHGVLMQMFSTQSDNLAGALTGESDGDIFAQIIRSVPTFCARSDVSSVVVPWICLHGIGHVIMYLSHNDIPHALAVCGTLPNATEASICAGGAFMEFIRDDANKDAVARQDFYPCSIYPAYAKPCFVYKGQPMDAVFGSAQSAIAACKRDAPSGELLACIRGAAVGGATLDMLHKPHGLDPMCGGLAGVELAACIDGAVTSVVFRMEADTPACSSMAQPYDAYCARESAQLRNLVLE